MTEISRAKLDAGTIFDAEYAEALASGLGTGGAWLILSFLGYSAKGRSDMARILVNALPNDEATIAPGGNFVAMQLRSWRIEALEALGRLLVAFTKRCDDAEDLLFAYARNISFPEVAKELKAIGTDRLAELLVIPRSAAEVPKAVRRRSRVPVDAIVQRGRQLLAVIDQVKQDTWEMRSRGAASSPVFGNLTTFSLRDVDNRFRHGTVILYPQCVPHDWISELVEGAEEPVSWNAGVHVFHALIDIEDAALLNELNPPIETAPKGIHWSWVDTSPQTVAGELAQLEGLALLTTTLCLSIAEVATSGHGYAEVIGRQLS